MKKVVILGAGITGLSVAWHLEKKYKKNIELTLLERSNQMGGLIRTIKKEGFLFETGPRGFRPSGSGRHALELVRAIGLEKDLIPAASDARKRYIWSHNRLRKVGLFYLLRCGALPALIRDWKALPCNQEDETIASFSLRHFGKPITEQLVDPCMRGIFGGSIYTLSARTCFPELWKCNQQCGSLIRGLLCRKKQKHSVSLYSFRHGMEQLPQRLAGMISARICLDTPVIGVSQLKKGWAIQTPKETIETEMVISAIPLNALGSLVEIPFEVPHATISTVNLGYTGIRLPRRGFGFLIPSYEDATVLGMTWDSHMFPQQNQKGQTRLCVMLGCEGPYHELMAAALSSVERYLGISTPPTVSSVHVAKEAIPQHPLHYHAMKRRLDLPNLIFMGTGFHGVGINQCIASAAQLCLDEL